MDFAPDCPIDLHRNTHHKQDESSWSNTTWPCFKHKGKCICVRPHANDYKSLLKINTNNFCEQDGKKYLELGGPNTNPHNKAFVGMSILNGKVEWKCGLSTKLLNICPNDNI
jgi:hypothetical protein